MYKFKVRNAEKNVWHETEAICVEDAVENVFREKCYCWETKDDVYILVGINNNKFYTVKEIK